MPDYKQTSTYVPALPEIAPPPTPLPEAPSIARDVSAAGAWFVLTVANVIVATVIIVGMLVDGSSAGNAILLGAAYFFPTMAIFVLALTGTFTDVIRSAQRERTERQRIDAYADLADKALDWRLAVEHNRLLELERDALPGDLKRRLAVLERDALDRTLDRGDADPVRAPSWVTPHPEQDVPDAKQEALRWAAGLYLDNGEPNPEAVQMVGKETALGRLRGPMLGSVRGAGSEAARLWLLDRRIILATRGGYALNLAQYPRAETLRYVD